MDIEGYKFVSDYSTADALVLIIACQNADSVTVIRDTDAMWHYMVTGQTLEGDIDGRTDTEEGTNLQPNS